MDPELALGIAYLTIVPALISFTPNYMNYSVIILPLVGSLALLLTERYLVCAPEGLKLRASRGSTFEEIKGPSGTFRRQPGSEIGHHYDYICHRNGQSSKYRNNV